MPPGFGYRRKAVITQDLEPVTTSFALPRDSHKLTPPALCIDKNMEVYMLPGECEAHTYLSDKSTGSGIQVLSNDTPGGSIG